MASKKKTRKKSTRKKPVTWERVAKRAAARVLDKIEEDPEAAARLVKNAIKYVRENPQAARVLVEGVTKSLSEHLLKRGLRQMKKSLAADD